MNFPEQTAAPNALYTHQTEPLLIVICGTSGVGKDTVIHRINQHSTQFHFVVTTTNRAKRTKEVDGVDYIFVSDEEFQRMIENNELLEYARVYDHYKGVSKAQVQQAFDSGKDVIVRVDVQGATTLRRLFPDALLIFITTRTEEELRTRLQKRNTESAEQIEQRIAAARVELESLPIFDYVVFNEPDMLEKTAQLVLGIIQSEHLKVHHRKVNL